MGTKSCSRMLSWYDVPCLYGGKEKLLPHIKQSRATTWNFFRIWKIPYQPLGTLCVVTCTGLSSPGFQTTYDIFPLLSSWIALFLWLCPLFQRQFAWFVCMYWQCKTLNRVWVRKRSHDFDMVAASVHLVWLRLPIVTVSRRSFKPADEELGCHTIVSPMSGFQWLLCSKKPRWAKRFLWYRKFRFIEEVLWNSSKNTIVTNVALKELQSFSYRNTSDSNWKQILLDWWPHR